MEGVYQTKKLARGGVRALGDKTRGRGTSCGGGQIEKAIHLRGQIYTYISNSRGAGYGQCLSTRPQNSMSKASSEAAGARRQRPPPGRT